MSQIKRKFLKLDNTDSGVNSRAIPANFTPSTYTPSEIDAEGTDKVSAHLKGIDSFLNNTPVVPSTDIEASSFSMANNVSTPTDITNFSFSNASVRSFEALVQISINATTSLFEVLTIRGIQTSSGWNISTTANGELTSVIISITSNGQMQYVSDNYTGFSSGTIKFRAITLGV